MVGCDLTDLPQRVLAIYGLVTVELANRRHPRREVGAEQIHPRRVIACGDRQRGRHSPQGERTAGVSIAPDRRIIPGGERTPFRRTRDMINGHAAVTRHNQSRNYLSIE